VPEANILDHLGPLALSPPLAAIYDINKQAWAQYRAMLSIQQEEDPPAHFMSPRSTIKCELGPCPRYDVAAAR